MRIIISVFSCTLVGFVIGMIFAKILKKKIHINFSRVINLSEKPFEKNENLFLLKKEDVQPIILSKIKNVLNDNIEFLHEEILFKCKEITHSKVKNTIESMYANNKTLNEVFYNNFRMDYKHFDRIKKLISDKIYVEIKNIEIEKLLANRVKIGIQEKIKQKFLMSMILNDNLLYEFEEGVEKSIKTYIDMQMKYDLDNKISTKIDEITELTVCETVRKTEKCIKNISVNQNLEIMENKSVKKDYENLIGDFIWNNIVKSYIEKEFSRVCKNMEKISQYIADLILDKVKIEHILDNAEVNVNKIGKLIEVGCVVTAFTSSIISNILTFL